MFFCLVLIAGVEPARPFGQNILSIPSLPFLSYEHEVYPPVPASITAASLVVLFSTGS